MKQEVTAAGAGEEGVAPVKYALACVSPAANHRWTFLPGHYSGLLYGAFAMSTDYDAWREGEESVTVAAVLAIMAKNSGNVKKALLNVIPKIAAQDWTAAIKAAHESRYIMGV